MRFSVYRKAEITEEQIVGWIKYYYEKEGRYPAESDINIWMKDEKGEWVKSEDETWKSITNAISYGKRCKIEGIRTFGELKRKHGLVTEPKRPNRKPKPSLPKNSGNPGKGPAG